MRSALESIESAARGFALTGNESYLKSFSANLPSAQEAEKNVGNLTVDNPEQQRQLPELRRLAAQQIELSQTAIAQRRTNNWAVDAIQGGPAPRALDEFQEVVSEMRGQELELLQSCSVQ